MPTPCPKSSVDLHSPHENDSRVGSDNGCRRIERGGGARPRPSGEWAVQRDGTKRADSLHSKKPAAIARAVELGKGATPRGQVRIKDERGKIVDERTYGNDPRRTRG